MFIFLLLFQTLCFAQEYDSNRKEVVLKQLNLSQSKIHNELYTERKMPNLEDSYIVVVPVLLGNLESDGFSVKNTILITDPKGKFKNKYLDDTEYTSDAISLDSFVIDTGLYTLNSNIRAFGVLANYHGSSNPNPYSSTDISLYYPEGKTLKKILNNYNLRIYSGEWDMNCAGEVDEDNSIIMIDQGKTNDLSHLKIKTKSTKTISKEINGECRDKKTSKIVYKTLKFNKSVYK